MTKAAESAKPQARPELSKQEILDLIHGWTWFAHVPREAREWLADRAVQKRVDKGQVVYVSGDPATQIYGVISGVFRIYMATAAGDEITLEEVVCGSWFPHIVPRDPLTYMANCVCQESADVLVVAQSVISEFATRWPAYYQGLYQEFANRAAVIGGRIELLSLHSLNVRLAVYLLRMLRLRGQPQTDGATWLPAFDSQTEVGSRVGGTRQRVNGIFTAWTRRGLIEPHKDGIRVLDVDALTIEARKSGFDLDSYLAGWHGGWQGRRDRPPA